MRAGVAWLVVASAVAAAGEAGADCPRRRADAAAYDRSSVAFVGEVVDPSVVPAAITDPVPADATAATACPVQASWTPEPGEACVIGVVTDGAKRVALTRADTITVGGTTAVPTPDGCFAVCGPRRGAFSLALAHDRVASHRAVGEDAVTVSVSLVTTTYTSRAQPKLADGEIRFVTLDRRHARRRVGAPHRELWSQLELHSRELGGAPPARPSSPLVRVVHAWKGVCPGDVIAVGFPDAACAVPWAPRTKLAVFGNLGAHGAIVVEGSDVIERDRTADQIRADGVVDRDCTR